MTVERDAAAVRIFPPAVPLAVVLAGFVLEWMWPLGAIFALPAPARYWVGAVIIAGAVLGLGLWAIIVMRRSGESENPYRPTTKIVLRGPYRISRNPMYLQMILVCLGFAVLLSNAWILVLTPVGAWALQRFVIRPEEAYLERKFGEDYLSYKRRVRRWL